MVGVKKCSVNDTWFSLDNAFSGEGVYVVRLCTDAFLQFSFDGRKLRAYALPYTTFITVFMSDRCVRNSFVVKNKQRSAINVAIKVPCVLII